MNLLVDIGNTRIKWAMEEYAELIEKSAIEYKNVKFSATIEQQWRALESPDNLAISSVGKQQIVQQILAIANKLWPETNVIIAHTSANAFSVNNAYLQPEKLGVDRWLTLIALQHYYPGNSTVVDCGTAITIDSINKEGQHLGGLISPGLQLMKQALHHGTAALSLSKKQHLIGLADTTESAIYTGTLYATVGLIEKTMNSLSQNDVCVLTGGDAQLLAPYLTLEYIIDIDFVLKGLALYCKAEALR